MQSTPNQSTSTPPSLEQRRAEERAHARTRLAIEDKRKAAKRLRQLAIDEVALNAATQSTRDTARANPTINTVWQQIKRNEAVKKRSESNRLLCGAKQQRVVHLFVKYSGLKTEDDKRRQKSNFDSPLREADRQRGIRMRDKYGGIETA